MFRTFAAALTLATVVTAATAADAAVIVTVQQSGDNVLVSASGSVDLAGLTRVTVSATGQPGMFSIADAVRGTTGAINIGSENASLYGYTGFSGPTSFGPGTTTRFGTANAFSVFALNASYFGTPTMFLQTSYVSGATIATSATFANTTIAGLGLTDGQYVFTWSSDRVTVDIGGSASAPTPEPATWATMIAGFAFVGGAMRRRRRVAFA